MDKPNDFRLHVDAANPYAGLIEKFLVGEFTPTVQTSRCQVLDLVTEAVLASGQVRYGPVPPPETVVVIREVLRYWIEQSRPIPFVIAWGSEKPNGTGIDVAELCALKTLTSLQKRVAAHYAPGIDANMFTRRVYYRTMPSRITNNHIMPWRAKGYLKVGPTTATAALTNFRTPQEYNPFEIVLERGDLTQVVQSDYVIV